METTILEDYEGASMAQYEAEASVKLSKNGGRVVGSRNDTKTKRSGGQVGEYENINKGVSPNAGENGSISVRDTIDLMQKAYNNIPAVGGAIDTMVALTNSAIKFVGTNKTAVRFFTAWEKKIQNWDFRLRFFRELFMSSNVFIYSFPGELTYSDFRKVTRANITRKIPLRYIILNPKDIQCNGAASFVNASYSKVLNSYEVKRLQNPSTPEEKEFVESLEPDAKRDLKKGTAPSITLKPENLTAIFDGKQDYQAMAIPRFFSCLKDCNFKEELRKTEMVLARTADKFLLLITCGEKDRDIKLNEQLRVGLTNLFSSESLGRVLISDYTVQGNFIIPDMNKIFGVDKYKAVNEDIANALMNIFWKDESFSNSMIKTQIFLERLQTAREIYVNMFLRPEMEKIAETLGFQEVPQVIWEDFALRDDVEYKKLYTRLCEVGILTASETLEAFKTHQLPSTEDSVAAQEAFKRLKDQDLYQPLVGKPKQEEGRPDGSKSPKKKIKVSPVGASDEKFSLDAISTNIKLANSISILIEEGYKKRERISRLSKKHKKITDMIWSSLIINEPKAEWESKVVEYLVRCPDYGITSDDSYELASTHNVDPVMGAILNCSRINE